MVKKGRTYGHSRERREGGREGGKGRDGIALLSHLLIYLP
jgi:hypothetical protein